MSPDKYVLRQVLDDDDDDALEALTELEMLKMLAARLGYRVQRNPAANPELEESDVSKFTKLLDSAGLRVAKTRNTQANAGQTPERGLLTLIRRAAP